MLLCKYFHCKLCIFSSLARRAENSLAELKPRAGEWWVLPVSPLWPQPGLAMEPLPSVPLSFPFPLFLRAPGPCWFGSFQQLLSTVLAQRCHLVPIHPCHSVIVVAYKDTAGTWHSFHLALWGFIPQPFCCHLPASSAHSCCTRLPWAPCWALWLSTALACGNTAAAAKHAALWHLDPDTWHTLLNPHDCRRSTAPKKCCCSPKIALTTPNMQPQNPRSSLH